MHLGGLILSKHLK